MRERLIIFCIVGIFALCFGQVIGDALKNSAEKKASEPLVEMSDQQASEWRKSQGFVTDAKGRHIWKLANAPKSTDGSGLEPK